MSTQKIKFDNNKIPKTTTIYTSYYGGVKKSTNLLDLAMYLDKNFMEYSDIIKCFRYGYKNENKEYVLYKRGIKVKKNKKNKVELAFKNAIFLELYTSDPKNIISVKLFCNGSISSTGFSFDKFKEFKNTIELLLKKIHSKNNTIFQNEINIIPPKGSMILCVVKQLTKFKFDNKKLIEFVNLNENNNLNAFYVSDKKQMVKIQYNRPDHDIQHFEITQNGVIKITVLTKNEIGVAVDFITNFLTINLDNIIYKDRVEIVLDILDLNKDAPEQGTTEWLEIRKGAINASEVFSALGLNKKYESRNSFINKKKKALLESSNTIDVETSRYYTSVDKLTSPMHRGNALEPVARDLYQSLFNKEYDDDRFINNKVLIYESSSISHWKNKIIRASPDGVVFMFQPKNFPNVPPNYKPTLKELRHWFNLGLIDDVIGLEIKCPSKYNDCRYSKKKDNEMTTTNAGLDKIPSGYWWQIQQQLYVMNLYDCHFIAFDFVFYVSYMVWVKKEENVLTRGIFAKIFKDDEKNKFIYVYPTKITMKLNSFMEELKDYDNFELIYWKLMDYKLTPVQFDKDRYRSALVDINEVYNEIHDL